MRRIPISDSGGLGPMSIIRVDYCGFALCAGCAVASISDPLSDLYAGLAP